MDIEQMMELWRCQAIFLKSSILHIEWLKINILINFNASSVGASDDTLVESMQSSTKLLDELKSKHSL